MEEGIRVTFNDSGRGDGNALRVVLLATLFAQAGFDITYIDSIVSEDKYGVCKFTARFNLQNDFDSTEKYAYFFLQALEILSRTKNLDYSIEKQEIEYPHYYDKYYIPKLTLKDFRKIKNSLDIPDDFLKGDTCNLIDEWNNRIKKVNKIRAAFENRQKLKRQQLMNTYDYLGVVDNNKSRWLIVYEYVRGKLIINNNRLEKNPNYDSMSDILSAVNSNIDETLKLAQIVNLLDYDKLNFETDGYIGDMIALSGVLRLDNRGWLSIKVAVDKERKRAKFAKVEYVDFKGNRKELSAKELVEILNKPEFNYEVKIQAPRSKSEKETALKILKEKILLPKDGIYMRGMGISGQTDRYIPVKITYDRKTVDENSMWAVSFISPEDIETIIKSKAILTTTNGMLSHAIVIANENDKTAILSNGQWKGSQLEIPYYSIESEITSKMGYEIQKIAEHKVLLNEGDIVLVNGNNGRMLLYNNISRENIDKIQKAIDANDSETIMEYIKNNYEDENIRQVIEYIFLQVVSDKSKYKITEILYEWEKDSEIGKKVLELDKVYATEKIRAIKEDILNEKSIEDENIRYMILVRLEQELKTLKYSCERSIKLEDFEKITEQIALDKEECIKAKYNRIRELKLEINNILAKKTLTKEDEDRLVDVITVAKVWNFYGNLELQELVEKVDEILIHENDISYETEIKNFSDISSRDVFDYGTKTVESAKMKKLFDEHPIKDVVALDGIGIGKNVLKLFFEKAGKGEQLKKLMDDFKNAIETGKKKLAVEIGKEITGFIEKIDDVELKEFIENKLNDGKNYAVRSSGVGEDGGNHAFAGMAETELNVKKENVYKALKECWKSFYTRTCIEDMLKEKIVVKPAVLIEEMVPNVKKAGVAFTRDKSGNFIAEVVWGYGQGLVSGRITPDHIVIAAHDGSINYRRALNNFIKIETDEDGGTKVSKLEKEQRIERIIDETTINLLKEIGLLLEEDSGYPVDFEYAIDENNKFYPLQRRAITTLSTQENIDYSKYEQTVLNIGQEVIDLAIENLKSISEYDNIFKEIIEKLSNLPKDVSERYDVIINQAYLSFETLIKYKSHDNIKKIIISALVPISTMVNVQGTEQLLLYSIVDMFFDYKEGERKDFEIIANTADIMASVYTINPKFVTNILNKLLDEGVISRDEEIPFSISDRLRKYGYDGLKQYYLTVSADEEVDSELSAVLKESLTKINKYIIPQIADSKYEENIKNALFNIDEVDR